MTEDAWPAQHAFADHLEELNQKHAVIRDRIRSVVMGFSTSLYFWGRPGTAKTYLVRTTLEAMGVSYVHVNGYVTPLGFFELLEANPEAVIVLDDVAAIFSSPQALQFFLAALGNPHDGSGVRYIKYEKSQSIRIVRFTGKLICLANMGLDGHHQPQMRALRDRMQVVKYDPTDDHIIAQIHELATVGVNSISPEQGLVVATYLIAECKLRGVRPSLRLFVDKAIPDFKLWEAGHTEADWHDLVRASIEESVVELRYEIRPFSKQDDIQRQRIVAQQIFDKLSEPEARVRAWKTEMNLSTATFYRRLKEVQEQGELAT